MPSNTPSRSVDTTLLPPKSRAKRWLSWLVKLSLIVATFVLAWSFVRHIGWQELFTRIRSANPILVSAAIVFMTLRFVFAYLRWLQPLRLLRLGLSHVYTFCSLLAAILLNHLTPTARLLGGVVRARYLSKRFDTLFSRAYGTALIDQVSHQLVHGALTWLALGLLSWKLGWRTIGSVLFLSLACTVVGLAVWRHRHRARGERPVASLMRHRLQRQARRLGPLYSGGREVADLFKEAFRDTGLQTWMAVYGSALLLTNAAAQWLIFRSLDTQVGFLEVLVTVAVGIAAGIVTNTPGGFATTEAAMIAIYVALGVPEVDAAAGSLIYRSLHYLLVVGLGIPALVYCESTSSTGATNPDRTESEDRSSGCTLDGGSPPGPAG